MNDAHHKACKEGQFTYIDPTTGLKVMTSRFLKSRGFCCGAGCRHCPYSKEEQIKAKRPNVPCFPFSEED